MTTLSTCCTTASAQKVTNPYLSLGGKNRCCPYPNPLTGMMATCVTLQNFTNYIHGVFLTGPPLKVLKIAKSLLEESKMQEKVSTIHTCRKRKRNRPTPALQLQAGSHSHEFCPLPPPFLLAKMGHSSCLWHLPLLPLVR